MAFHLTVRATVAMRQNIIAANNLLFLSHRYVSVRSCLTPVSYCSWRQRLCNTQADRRPASLITPDTAELSGGDSLCMHVNCLWSVAG